MNARNGYHPQSSAIRDGYVLPHEQVTSSQIALSLFRHKQDTLPGAAVWSWTQLKERLGRHALRPEKDGPCFSPVRYKAGATRGNGGVECVMCFVGDVEDGTTPGDLRGRWQAAGGEPLAYALYSTFQSTTDAPRWRIVFPLAQPVPGADWPRTWRRLTAALLGGHNDAATKDQARLSFFPTCPPDKQAAAFTEARDGAWLDPGAYPDPPAEDFADSLAATIRRRDRQNNPDRQNNHDRQGHPVTGTGAGTDRPGDDFNARATAEEVARMLEGAGWRECSHRGAALYLTRPGKAGGVSGVVGFPNDPAPIFSCFTSSAPPFEPGRAYAPFTVKALTQHGGDFGEAARQLAAEGFGDQTAPRSLIPMPSSLIPLPTDADAPPEHEDFYEDFHPAAQQQDATQEKEPTEKQQNAGKQKAERPTPPPRKSIAERVIDMADIAAPPPLPRLFGDYLLAGATHWLTGQTGIGKSTFAYNLATSMAEGHALWDIPCRQSKLLYLDMENGEWGRSKKLERLYLDQPRIRGHLLFVGEPIRLPDELDALIAYVNAEKIELVIFDTARRCFAVKDENDNAEFYQRIVPTLDALKRAGVASLVLGHPAKGSLGGARGAQSQEDAGDVNLTLTMHAGQVTDKDGTLALRVTKNRLLGLDIAPLYLQRVGGDHFRQLNAAEAETSSEEGKQEEGKQERCRADLQDYLRGRPDHWATYNEITDAMQKCSHSLSTAKRAHKELTEAGLVVRASPTEFAKGGWLLSEEGSGPADA